jgi:glyoxylase-like metal-dependent hydrolase (beta-lactamase superfamily II)
MTCGFVTGDAASFLEGASGPLRLPVPSFLVEHPRGRVLFDSGLAVSTQTDPVGRLGPLARAMQIEFRPGEEVGARLRAMGVEPASIDHLVVSHLHFDHVGGNAQIPNARVVVQRREWEAGRDADLVRASFYDPREYDLGHEVLAIDGEHDLFGDGSVVCLPTPGHTAGHQSLRVRLASGDVVLTADACYFRRTLEELALPPFAYDREAQLRSLLRLRELQGRGARLVFGHDAERWATLPQAPDPIS